MITRNPVWHFIDVMFVWDRKKGTDYEIANSSKGLPCCVTEAISSSVPFCSVFLFVFQRHGHFRRDQDI